MDASIQANISRPKLLDRMRGALRSRHCSRRTEKTYVMCVTQFIYFHAVGHPAEIAEPQINVLLTQLAVKEKAGASTQRHALSALLLGG